MNINFHFTPIQNSKETKLFIRDIFSNRFKFLTTIIQYSNEYFAVTATTPAILAEHNSFQISLV